MSARVRPDRDAVILRGSELAPRRERVARPLDAPVVDQARRNEKLRPLSRMTSESARCASRKPSPRSARSVAWEARSRSAREAGKALREPAAGTRAPPGGGAAGRKPAGSPTDAPRRRELRRRSGHKRGPRRAACESLPLGRRRSGSNPLPVDAVQAVCQRISPQTTERHPGRRHPANQPRKPRRANQAPI